jgi:hypothetical protein
MKYVSIDIETTGLDSDSCDIIEFAAIIDDLKSQKPIDKLSFFHAYILPPIGSGQYKGQPYALSMHSKIFKRIATLEKPYMYLQTFELAETFSNWLSNQDVTGRITVAGKNYGMFDDRFLRDNDWKEYVGMHHRVLDPAMYFLNPYEDKCLPDTKTCKERANVWIENFGTTEPFSDVEVAHTALEDAKDVVKLMRVGAQMIDGADKVF